MVNWEGPGTSDGAVSTGSAATDGFGFEGQHAQNRFISDSRTGLDTMSFIPASRHAMVSSAKTLAVKAMIGTVCNRAAHRAIVRVASSPSISGILTSIRMTS